MTSYIVISFTTILNALWLSYLLAYRTKSFYTIIRLQDVLVEKTTLHIDTLYDCLNDMCSPPGRNDSAAMRMPVSGIYKIKGVGDVIAGRIEQVRMHALFSRLMALHTSHTSTDAAPLASLIRQTHRASSSRTRR